VQLKGLETIPDVPGPTLVLPNHPGYIDPVLVMTQVGQPLELHPLASSTLYRFAFLRALLRPTGAVEVPSLEEPGVNAREKVQQMVERVITGLDRGENFLIYPSGRIELDGREHIVSAHAVSDILLGRPKTNVVLLRTVGLWGSLWTKAVTGDSPRLGACLLRCAWVVLSNLIFFVPRREIQMTVEWVEAKNLPGLNREQLNPWLQEWYNRELSPEPVYVPYHFLFGPRTFAFPPLGKRAKLPLDKVSAESKEGVYAILEEKLKHPLLSGEKSPDTLLDHLGLDSLDRTEIAQSVTRRFGHAGQEIAATVGELWMAAEGLVLPKNKSAGKKP